MTQRVRKKLVARGQRASTNSSSISQTPDSANFQSLGHGALSSSFSTVRGIPLNKTSAPDSGIRPIGIGSLWVTMASTLAVRHSDVQSRVTAAVGPTELMHGVSGGVESVPHLLRVYLATHPGHVAAKADTANAFNSVDRRWSLEAARKFPTLVSLSKLLYGRDTSVVFTKRRRCALSG